VAFKGRWLDTMISLWGTATQPTSQKKKPEWVALRRREMAGSRESTVGESALLRVWCVVIDTRTIT